MRTSQPTDGHAAGYLRSPLCAALSCCARDLQVSGFIRAIAVSNVDLGRGGVLYGVGKGVCEVLGAGLWAVAPGAGGDGR